jgi:cyclopropane fatty-acyl-phospholipid synthase-like methyltransferase
MIDPNFPTRYPDLRHRFYFVHSANVIHLFGVAGQETFFRNLVHLAAPGGTIWGRQVGLAEESEECYRQPDGKGARFTINEFRELALRVGNWDEQDARYEAQLVKYDEIRAQRQDKAWVLQWSVKVPMEKEKGRGAGAFVRDFEELD